LCKLGGVGVGAFQVLPRGAVSEEEASIQSYESLVAAKKKEMAALTKEIEAKTSRVGEIAVQVAEAGELTFLGMFFKL
jgi:hypothetical protein